MNGSELLEDSDSSDEDYIPEKKSRNVSDTDSNDNNSDHISGDEAESSLSLPRKKKESKVRPRKKHKTIEGNDLSGSNKSKELSEDEKKKIEEDVWADFMKDTGFKSKNDRFGNVSHNKAKPQKPEDCKLSCKEKIAEKVKITEIFNFAGEKVTIEKEVLKNSEQEGSTVNPKSRTSDKSNCKSQLGGISGIINQLGKKNKISTLEKSKLDWDRFKKEENLEEELQTHNRGKDGYLEKQDFLERADLRRFEIEREIRSVERNKRVNYSSQ